MTYREHATRLWALGTPLILSHLAQMIIGATDTLMMGWYDVTGLAAVSLMSSLSFVLMIVGAGFAFAVMPLVASAAELGDEVEIRRVTRMGLWLSSIYFVLILPLMIWSEPILLAIGQEPEVAAIAQEYARINVWSIFFALFVMVLKSYLSALEITRIVLWSTASAAVINALVNYSLIFGNWGMPEMGARGAAIASVVSALMTFVVLAVYALAKIPEHDLFKNLWRPDRDVLLTVFRLGWPIGLTNLAETGLFAATSILMGWLGTVPLAAHGIALQISALTFMVHVGLSSAATVRAGRAMGRRNPVELRQGAQVAIASSLVFAGLTMILFIALPETLVGLFVDPADPERPQIIATGIGLLYVAAAFQVADSAQVMALGLLRGVQDTRVPMIMAAVSYWGVGIGAAYLLGFTFGLEGIGVWAGLVVGLGLAGITMQLRFWRRSLPRVTAVA